MSKVLFSIQYEIENDKRDEYLTVVRELKNLLKADGLESYSVYEVKGKPNHFEEIYTFNSNEAYENFDDNQTERISILLNKLNGMVKGSSKYTTLNELEIEG
jgi:quinol monooxygenase YgiN